MKLKTVGGDVVLCTEANFIGGRWTGPKTATINEINLFPCDYGKSVEDAEHHLVLCNENIFGSSTVKNPTREIKTLREVEAELGFIQSGATPRVGLEIKSPANPETPMFTFFCGGVLSEEQRIPQTWIIGGAVIGEIKPLNTMKEEHKFLFSAEGGKQVPEAFEGGPKATLSAQIIRAQGSRTEQIGFILGAGSGGLIPGSTEEPLEIKAN